MNQSDISLKFKELKDELALANKALAFENEEKEKLAAELVIAKQEKGKRADELVIANEKLVFENNEKTEGEL